VFTTSRAASGRRLRAFGLPALLACMLTSAGCGKTISIEDAEPSPTTSSTATPSDTAGAGTVQIVEGSAEENGQTGTGGTVTGSAAQVRPPRWVQLSAVRSPDLDSAHLVDVNQSSLYRFDEDGSSPSRSNCDGDCSATWPPVTLTEGGGVYLAGIDPELLGAIRRDDGQIQLTVGGWPIYRFAGDAGPGELEGQGMSGTWFAVGPDGDRVL
jgi:predicted lipoprotein with Yx(FWY)xxD motif